MTYRNDSAMVGDQIGTIAGATEGGGHDPARRPAERGLLQPLARLRSLTIAERVVYGSTCLYASVFTGFAIVRHLAFQSQSTDLGTMAQVVWNTAHGHFLESSTNTGQMIRLGVHVDPFLALMAPLWWAWPSPLLLVTLQALAVSAGALPVFWLARKHLASERAAAFFALAYLLFPATQFDTFAPATGFHAVTIAIPLLLYAIWFLDEDRLVAFAVVGLLAATTKEEVPLLVGILGIWYGSSHGRWRVGLSIFAAGLTVTLFNFLFVLPHFNGGAYRFGDRYSEVGGSPAGIAHTAVTDPVALIQGVASMHKLVFVSLLFVPFLGLWLFEPLLLLGVAPDLAIDLLSSAPGQTNIIYANAATMIPFIVAGSILGLARLRLRGQQTQRISFYVFAAVAAIAIYSPLIGGSRNLAEAFASNPLHQAKTHALSLIPRGVPVSASNQLGAQLAERRRLMFFPYVYEARWIIVDKRDPTYANPWYQSQIDRFRHNGDWREVYASRGVMVLHKVVRRAATTAGSA